MIIDMYDGTAYDPKRHSVPRLFWSDGRMRYWGWIYHGKEIVGDFTAETAQDAEQALGMKFVYD